MGSTRCWAIMSASSATFQCPTCPRASTSSIVKADGQLMVRVNGWQTPGEIWMTDPVARHGNEGICGEPWQGSIPRGSSGPRWCAYKKRATGWNCQGLLYLPEGAGTGADGAARAVQTSMAGPSGQSVASFSAVNQYHVRARACRVPAQCAREHGPGPHLFDAG